jgi:hypothetical protein
MEAERVGGVEGRLKPSVGPEQNPSGESLEAGSLSIIKKGIFKVSNTHFL